MDEELRELVRKSGLTYEQVAFGAGVTVTWLSKFMSGKIKSAGVCRYEKVRNHLTPKATRKRPAVGGDSSAATHSSSEQKAA